MTYRGWHPAEEGLIPTNTANPVILGAGTGVRGEVVPRAGSHLIERFRAKKVNRVKKLAILQQMAMAVPESRNDVAIQGLGVAWCIGIKSSIAGFGLIFGGGPDGREGAVDNGEALGRGLLGVVSSNTLVAVRDGVIMVPAGRDEQRLLLEAVRNGQDDDNNGEG